MYPLTHKSSNSDVPTHLRHGGLIAAGLRATAGVWASTGARTGAKVWAATGVSAKHVLNTFNLDEIRTIGPKYCIFYVFVNGKYGIVGYQQEGG